jgi:hypothetical protein
MSQKNDRKVSQNPENSNNKWLKPKMDKRLLELITRKKMSVKRR